MQYIYSPDADKQKLETNSDVLYYKKGIYYRIFKIHFYQIFTRKFGCFIVYSFFQSIQVGVPVISISLIGTDVTVGGWVVGSGHLLKSWHFRTPLAGKVGVLFVEMLINI